MIENAEKNALKELIIKSSESVSKSITTLSQLSDIDKFYWSFIASCCTRIQVGVKDLKKLNVFAFAIENLSSVYLAYCNKKSNILQPLCEVPEDIKHTDVREYFKWIIRVQTVLIHWQELFRDQAYNYDDVMAYAGMLATVEKLAQSLNITELVFEIEQIEKFKANYHENYAELCSLVIKKTKDFDGYVIDTPMYVHAYAHACVCMYRSIHMTMCHAVYRAGTHTHTHACTCTRAH